MATEITVPQLGESVTEATVASWMKQVGEAVKADEPLVELETDKVTLEVPAPAAGVLTEIIADEGDTVEVAALLGKIDENASASAAPAKKTDKTANAEKAPAQKAAASAPAQSSGKDHPPSPSAQRIIEEEGLDASKIQGTGRDGRVTKADALAALEMRAVPKTKLPEPSSAPRANADREKRVPMTRLRRTIAQRLKDAQNTAAMLTTFNEVDMSHVMKLRSEYKEKFLEQHGVKLGFMGFFVKACVNALREIPDVNAEIDGTDVIYKDYYDIGIAVGTEKGLVVPVVRDADRLSLAEIEATIGDFGARARDGKLTMDDMMGGTFTVSNGGVYGSLMSTPILNPPQAGILGMHKIEQRPVVVDGEITIRPMMYLALSYDHRLVDGKGAVTFLVRVKEALEDPQRLILEL
jgi:2-oxoglutarate dehydrogenase E2 component (dihydrolipoamide succinyltransferase)